MPDTEVTPTATSSVKPKRARKAKVAPAPKPPAKERKKPVHAVTAYLGSLTPAHREAAKVLGAAFRSDLRDELAVNDTLARLASRRDSLEHDLQQVTESISTLRVSCACRDKLDGLAKSIAHHKGLVAHADEQPTATNI